MHDIDLTCEEPLDPADPVAPRFGAETEELRGCWRTFFRFFGITAVLIVILIVYMILAVWQPWESAADRAAEERAAQLAALPPMPDVIGVSVVDVAFQLADDYRGVSDVYLFDATHHATKVEADMTMKTDINVGQLIMATVPPPGATPTNTVGIWIGPRPDVPAGVPPDSFWYDHAADVQNRGSGPCLLQCHSTPDCESCHELRLRSASSPFLVDPEESPELALAVASAADIPVEQVLAVYQGIGWYRIDILIDDAGEMSDEIAAARVAAVTALPTAFNTQDDAEVIVFRWMVTGVVDPVVEIGLERETHEQIQWMTVEPADIPWVVDRFAVDER